MKREDRKKKQNSFLEIYAEYLRFISINLILWLSIITLLSLYFYYGTIWLVTWFFCGVIMAIHSLITRKIINKELKSYWILKTEDQEYYLSFILISIFLVCFVLIPLNSYVNLESIMDLIIVMFFISLQSMTFLLVHSFSFLIPNSRRVKLRLDITLPCIIPLKFQDKKSRCYSINSHFKWFKEALSFSNTFIGKNFPNHPEVIDIESYYNAAYLKALVGNNEELDELKENIEEFRTSIEKEDFKRFLISLQRLKGKTNKKDISLDELITLFKLRSRAYQIIAPLMRVLKFTPSLIIVIIGVLLELFIKLSLGL
jgi:hypothetical protein